MLVTRSSFPCIHYIRAFITFYISAMKIIYKILCTLFAFILLAGLPTTTTEAAVGRNAGIFSFDFPKTSAPVPETPLLTTDKDARSIFEELDRRRSSAEYETAAMTMIIHNTRGRTRTRELRTWSINRENITKQIVFFESPADVRDTGLLTITENGEESQRIYLPAVGRVQAIGASQRGDRFMGSDFTYEDLGQQDPDQFDFTEKDRNSERIILEALPKRKSRYERIHFHIDPDQYLLIKAEYINSSGEVFKRLELHDYQNAGEEMWRPGYMVMHDLENDRKTELRWENRTFNDPIPEDFFSDRQLRRGIPR